MTRKHFQQLAEALKATKPLSNAGATTWQATVRAVADVCKANCAGFKRKRFYVACDYDDAR